MIKSNIIFLLNKENFFSSIDIHFAIYINSFYKDALFLIILSLYLSKHTRLGNSSLSLSGLYALITKEKNYSKFISNYFNKIYIKNKIDNNIFSSSYLMIYEKVIISPTKYKYAPIILYNEKLYLYKVWYSLQRIKKFFIKSTILKKNEYKKIYKSNEIIINIFNKLCKEKKLNCQQKIAIIKSIVNRLTIITGGPGTGKTSLIIQIIKYIRYISKKKLLIYLLAPTGKATLKLIYLINNLNSNILKNTSNKILINIENISTLHKRLKVNKDKEDFLLPSTQFLDVLIIDEASMVNLDIMEKVINNLLSQKTKIILIGDPDQLNAVSSVGIFNNIIYWIKNYQKFDEHINIDKPRIYLNNNYINNIAVLKKIYRFKENSGIAILSKAIKEENISLIKKIYLRQNQFNDIRWYSWGDGIYKLLINQCVNNCKKLIINVNKQKDKINYISKYLNDLQILCLLNKGKYGSDKINEMIELNLSYISKKIWYNGKPIIILKNDPDLLLSNGEIGISLLNNILGEWEVIFLSYNTNKVKQIRKVKLKDIKHFKTAWSITIHKSQGSEFNKVIFILPPMSRTNIYNNNQHNYKKLITKELIYTAITRAKKKLIIYANLDTILCGLKHSVK